MHQSSFEKMTDFRKKHLENMKTDSLKILDLGSMDVNGSYKPIFDEPAWEYRGADMAPGDNVDIVLSNPYHWREIPSASIDIMISGQAFEHIEYFWLTMLEVDRIVKPGGLCCIIAPSGGFEHRYPVDCWRFYPDGFRVLAEFGNFECLECFTQWQENPEYTVDDSNLWKDTVLIGRKPHVSVLKLWRKNLRRWALRKLLMPAKKAENAISTNTQPEKNP